MISPHSRAHPPPEIEHTIDTETSSLVDVDSEHVGTVPSDYKSQQVKTSSQADRLEREAKDEATELEHKAETKAHQAKKEAKHTKDQAKHNADKAGKDIRDNSDNPVYIANAVAVVALSGALGFGAYQKYARNELSWGVVGTWAGVVGLFAVGDYYLSQFVPFPYFLQ